MHSNDESSRDAAQSAPWWDTDDWIVHIEDELRVEQMAGQKTADRVITWMEENAQWYADHSAYPVADMAEEALNLFDREKWEQGRSEDWAYFMENKRCKQAERVFKSLKLPMHKDAEE